MSSWREEVANVGPGSGKGTKIDVEGHGIVKLIRIEERESVQNLGILWISEFELLDSWGENHPKGSIRSRVYFPETGQWRELQQQSIRAQVMSANGIDPNDELGPAKIGELIEDALDGGLEDCLVRLQTIPSRTKNNRDHTLHIWNPHTLGKKVRFDETVPSLPPGWQQHPTNPTYAWNTKTREVKKISEL